MQEGFNENMSLQQKLDSEDGVQISSRWKLDVATLMQHLLSDWWEIFTWEGNSYNRPSKEYRGCYSGVVSGCGSKERSISLPQLSKAGQIQRGSGLPEFTAKPTGDVMCKTTEMSRGMVFVFPKHRGTQHISTGWLHMWPNSTHWGESLCDFALNRIPIIIPIAEIM